MLLSLKQERQKCALESDVEFVLDLGSHCKKDTSSTSYGVSYSAKWCRLKDAEL